jgi:phosphopantetheinyl transferase (holo-ACP synthase)
LMSCHLISVLISHRQLLFSKFQQSFILNEEDSQSSLVSSQEVTLTTSFTQTNKQAFKKSRNQRTAESKCWNVNCRRMSEDSVNKVRNIVQKTTFMPPLSTRMKFRSMFQSHLIQSLKSMRLSVSERYDTIIACVCLRSKKHSSDSCDE